MDIQERLADRAKNKAPSAIRELVKYMNIDGMISLGGGYPNPDTFVFERVKIEFKGGKAIEIDGEELIAASQYGPSDANANLKKQLQAWHKYKDGVDLKDDQIVVLNGCQEGLFIMAYLFANHHDRIIIEEPIYPGTLAAFRSFTKNFLAIPVDAHGMQTEVLADELEKIEMTGEPLPKFIYTIPNGHNPAGVSLSLDRRKQLLDIAEQYDLLVLEDDPYQLLRLDHKPPLPTLQSLDENNRVIRLDSFSKIFAPGLRIGYVSGPAEVMRQFVLFKQSANLHTSTFIQVILLRYLQAAGFEQFIQLIKRNCDSYRVNRDAMVAAARKHLLPEVKYNIPDAGMFIWFELPQQCNARRMIEEQCEERKVLLVPGDAFSSQNGCKNFMRASFSMVTPEQIDEGMRRFAEMIKHELHR
ncbi:MAG: PLP-dependent aminotransferase family protein [candidate division KSB1 bacterium]|nr:PLP-dependent aminotransferase family protein [candidate division KSB1 bacterium]MDZ7358144.1 PLP-dependent aminotransferase family protein [candidate division KSB1 bacterium]MDZ7398771.1 PLP-dependent aminotransferase family protein [candidate division KSB1 bacterium]